MKVDREERPFLYLLRTKSTVGRFQPVASLLLHFPYSVSIELGRPLFCYLKLVFFVDLVGFADHLHC